jgi:uncharacterized protein YbjT (DUF2867 family)
MKVLVYCANGLQGQPIVHELLKSGHHVRALVREVNRAAPLAAAGAEIAAADLTSDNLSDLERAHNGIEFVILLLASGADGPTRRQAGERALACIRSATSLKGIIFNASVQYPRHMDALPTFAATKEIEDALRQSAIPLSVVRPTFYLQNLLLPYARLSIATRGVLAYPVVDKQPLSWVATEDIARLIGHLLQHNAMGVAVDAGGQLSLDGHELARRFSEGLGRPIRYEALDLDEFERGVDQALGPGVGKRVSGIFRFIQGHPDDLEFVSKPFVQPPGVPHFESTDVTKWVAAHSKDFAALATARQ